MDYGLFDLFTTLIRNMSVFMIIAYFLTRTPSFGDILNRRFSWKNRILLTGAFGIFSIYGTLSGIEIFGAVANFRDLGPTVAGLLAGPFVGTVSGLIGGLYRYQLGGPTALPCALAPIMAGLAGGLLCLAKKNRDIRMAEAVLLMIAMELCHGLITLAISGAREEVLAIIRAVLPPMIVANGAGMAVFIFMVQNLARERRTAAAKHRIESELNIAREIQMSMVPPAPSGDTGYRIHGLLQPAREVGGDLYNIFALDRDRLCLAIGDVAGKGVPASLYMAITQKLIKAAVRDGEGPAALLSRLNRELCDRNDTLTFVTLFIGFYDTRTGGLVFSNAGHNPPYLVRSGVAARLAVEPAMAIGIQEGVAYADRSLQLEKGDALFLYTDGVTEAMDSRGNQYSEAHLTECLARLAAADPAALCQGILEDIKRFVGGTEQSDDITMVALAYQGPAGAEERSATGR